MLKETFIKHRVVGRLAARTRRLMVALSVVAAVAAGLVASPEPAQAAQAPGPVCPAGQPHIGIEYRVHMAGIGWGPWVRNGAAAGTTGQSRRMEAIEARVIGCEGAYTGLSMAAHVQNFGWNGPAEKRNNVTCYSSLTFVSTYSPGWSGCVGTQGRSLRMEALRFGVGYWLSPHPSIPGGPIRMCSQAHLSGTGWGVKTCTSWVNPNAPSARSSTPVVGTVGQSRQMEAIKIWFERY